MSQLILVVNPALLRLNNLGACEQDRLINVHRLIALGHTVKLLTGFMPYQKRDEVSAYYAAQGIDSHLVPIGTERLHPTRLRDYAFIDGMAWEYGQPGVIAALDDLLTSFRPSLVWSHGSYLWAIAAHARQRGFCTVIRSVNYEPAQMLHENGTSLINRIRLIGKQAGERHATRAHVLAAITPDEAEIYRRLNPNAHIHVLPLRALPALLRPPRPALNRLPLHVFFMGASYNVPHNVAALKFIVNDIVPRVRQAAPDKFVFHLLGSKVPAAMMQSAAADVIFDGYVPDLDAHLAGMDIALAPSLFGVGMQQKVFEPLARAFPTITHQRALAGYPFQPAQEVLTAESADEYTHQLIALLDPAMREQLSHGAAERSHTLFSQSSFDQRLNEILSMAVC